MNMEELLATEVQAFIAENSKTNVKDLAFKKNPFPHIQWQTVLQQIHAKQKAEQKLPTWYKCGNIIYPSTVSVEQTSSEITAAHKASLIHGSSLIDLTGGFGVDDYYFAKHFQSVTHCEYQEDLSAMVAHNFQQLGANNIRCISGDSLSTLQNLQQQFDWIYIDPARRSAGNNKVFFLKDCQPDVVSLLDTYFQYTQQILIKTSPLLDITATLKDLKHVKEVHIVALHNEVKELLWMVTAGYNGTTKIIATNINKDSQEHFESIFADPSVAQYNVPQKYLYVPNAAIMKSGNFDAICTTFDVAKLHPHSHLYTSNEVISFPGRSFIIEEQIPYNKQAMKSLMKTKANIAIRNFPLQVEELIKKYKLDNGGDKYYFFTTIANDEKVVLICSKLEQGLINNAT